MNWEEPGRWLLPTSSPTGVYRWAIYPIEFGICPLSCNLTWQIRRLPPYMVMTWQVPRQRSCRKVGQRRSMIVLEDRWCPLNPVAIDG
jgi:hypothetical protein